MFEAGKVYCFVEPYLEIQVYALCSLNWLFWGRLMTVCQGASKG